MLEQPVAYSFHFFMLPGTRRKSFVSAEKLPLVATIGIGSGSVTSTETGIVVITVVNEDITALCIVPTPAGAFLRTPPTGSIVRALGGSGVRDVRWWAHTTKRVDTTSAASRGEAVPRTQLGGRRTLGSLSSKRERNSISKGLFLTPGNGRTRRGPFGRQDGVE